MKKTILNILIISTLFFFGCARNISTNQQLVMEGVKTTKKDTRGVTWIKGPWINNNLNFFGNYQYRLRIEKHYKIYQLYIKTKYRMGWWDFNHVCDSEGKKIEFTEISKYRSGAYTVECFALNLSKEYLEKHIDGMTFNIFGEYGDILIHVPYQYVRGFLAGVY